MCISCAARRHLAAGVPHRVELIPRGDEHAAASRRIAQHDEQRPFARVGQVERRLEQPLRKLAVADRSAHMSYFAWMSSRCQRALRKLKTCAPSANTLISCDGLSTMQMFPLPVWRARENDTAWRRAPSAWPGSA